MLKHILLPLHWVRNRRHAQRKLGIGADGKEVEMGTTEHLINLLKHPQKKRPFCGNNLVGMTDLVRLNILPPRNIPGR